MEHPRAGTHYPRSVGELQAWFRTDADCLDYLEWLRWPAGFVCLGCGHNEGWRLGDGRWMCPSCGDRTSATAGTVFDRTRTPLTVWFTACWLFATAHCSTTVSTGAFRRRADAALQVARSRGAASTDHDSRTCLGKPKALRITTLGARYRLRRRCR